MAENKGVLVMGETKEGRLASRKSLTEMVHLL
jgi:hypothetical protein